MTTNHGVVELHLDDAAVEKLRYAWHRLEAEGVDSQMPATGARPHVSLVAGAGLDFSRAAERLDALCARQRPLGIELPYLGLFPGEQCVGFLGVAQIQDLIDLHARVFEAVEGCFKEIHPHYRPPSIVLHSTLALAIPREQLPTYWQVVNGVVLPNRALVEQIDLVEYFPAQVKASLLLTGC
jgi:2'-5' RNA ligase